MKRTLVAVGILAFVWTGLARAQTEVKPTRSPEVQRMEGYIGDWAFEEKTWESPTSPEQTVKGTWQARWLGNQIEWRSRWTAGDKEQTAVEVEGWDPVKKAQYSSWFVSDGTRGSLTGSWSGTTLMADGTWLSGEGKPGKARCSFAYGTNFTAVEYRCESGEKGKAWVSRTGKAVKVVPSTATAMGTGKVLGIHEVVLKPGVAPADFERFAAEEWSPVVREVFPGVDGRIYKGERGRAPGSYLLVYEISSLRVRDYYFPGQGQGMSEVAQALDKACGKQCEQVWNRLSELTTLIGFTDYYALVKK
jgi:hypothetical protein